MRRYISIFVVFVTIFMSSPGWSQESPSASPVSEQVATGEVVVWAISAPSDELSARFREGVRDALSDSAGRHLLGADELDRWVAERAGPMPPCFKGLEPCVSPTTIIFEALDLSLVVQVKIASDGKSASWTAVDARGQALDEGVAKGETRQLGFRVVADLFDATGAVSIETIPAGAEVTIDGAVVGTSPHLARLPVGKHEYLLRLDGYELVSDTVEARSAGTRRVEHELKQLSGVLMISDAPPNASVFVNGSYKGQADSPIELAPGNYAIEVRADGYEPLQDSAEVTAGQRVTRSAPLSEVNTFLKDFGEEAIAVNNYVIRVGYEHIFQNSTHQDARSGDDIPYEFSSFADDDGLQPGVPTAKTLHGNGVRADFSYSFTNFGIVLLSASYHAGSPDEEIFVRTPEGTDEAARLYGIQRLQLRPFQISYRHFYNNFVPFAEVGTGIDFQWLDVESDVFGAQSLSQSDAFVTLGIGAQYFFTPELFALARYSLQGYFDSAFGADHLLYVGAGIALPNLFGFDAEPPESL